ncbi:MAG: glycosyltransferase family 4 protein [Candidatus Cloacimonetes bacterium]|nr:glycosyltransferase family 4 protein [Candidatus Cloacimonadota bacterium]
MKNKELRVLFVSSGNSKKGISPIVKNQGETLKENGIDISWFTIKGKGIKGYLKNISVLRKIIITNNYDLIHAHYSMSAYITSLASLGMRVPIVCSLMGSDIQTNKFNKLIINFFYRYLWKRTIVKSERMKTHICLKNTKVIPNGVNLLQFNKIEKNKAQDLLGFDKNKKNIIWVSNPKRYEKNYKLALNAINFLKTDTIKLNIVNGVDYQDIPKYMYAADLLILTSLWEGSPNVIKEAMACNCPIVSTDVGDVRWIIGNTIGCFITLFDSQDVANNIQKVLNNGTRTNGRERIITLGLDSVTIAKKIIKIYNEVL